MPLPQFWTVCFFVMFMLLAVDSHVMTGIIVFVDQIRCLSVANKTLWLCHQFVDVESFITTVSDMFPKWFHKPMRQEIFVLVVCASAFLMELLLVTEVSLNSNKKTNSQFRKQVVLRATCWVSSKFVLFREEFTSSTSLITTPLPESAGIFLPFVNVWLWAGCLVRQVSTRFFNSSHEQCKHFYWLSGGGDLVNTTIEDMTGSKPSVFFKLCWKYVIPSISLVRYMQQQHEALPLWGQDVSCVEAILSSKHLHVFLFTQMYFIVYLMDFKNLRIGSYVYPAWTYVLGVIITLSSVLIVPLFALLQIYTTPGTLREVSVNLQHSLPHKWG